GAPERAGEGCQTQARTGRLPGELHEPRGHGATRPRVERPVPQAVPTAGLARREPCAANGDRYALLHSSAACSPRCSPPAAPAAAAYPSEMRDPEGYWNTSNLYFMTPGINTRLLSKDEAPKTYEDLLNPRWKGQMGWSTSAGAGAPTFVGNVLLTMGQDRGMAYLEQLSKQGIRNLNV